MFALGVKLGAIIQEVVIWTAETGSAKKPTNISSSDLAITLHL